MYRSRFFLLFFILFSFSLQSVAQDKFIFPGRRSHISLPARISHNLVVIPVSINNSPPLNFILDTGVKTTILTEPLIAGMLDLDLSQKVLIYGLGGEGLVEAARAEGVSMQIGRLRAESLDLIVLPEGMISFSETFGFQVHGIIGHDLFRQFALSIDFINSRVRIYRQATYPVRRNSRVIPLELRDGKPYAKIHLVGYQGDTLSRKLLVDLGASHPLYLKQDYMHLVPRTLEGFLGKGLSGALTGHTGRLQSAVLQEISISEPIVAFPDTEFITLPGKQVHWEGIIGGGILSRFNLVIDYPSSRMVLRPNARFDKPFTFNQSGLEVIAGGAGYRKFIIDHVRPGSSAYEAGLISGDQILTLNQRSHQQLSLQQIKDQLSGRASKRIHMTVLRNQQIHRVQFRLRDDI